jgi:hypothetical protein
MYETLRSIIIDRMFKNNGVDTLRSRPHFQRVFRQAALVALANRAVAEHDQVVADDVLSYSNLQAYGLITLQALQGDMFRVVMSPIVLDAWITLQGTPYRKEKLMLYRNVNLGYWLLLCWPTELGSTASVSNMHGGGELMHILRALPLVSGAPVAGNSGQKVWLAVAFCPTCKSDLRDGMPQRQVSCLPGRACHGCSENADYAGAVGHAQLDCAACHHKGVGRRTGVSAGDPELAKSRQGPSL